MRLCALILLGITVLLVPFTMKVVDSETVVQKSSGNGIRTFRPFEVEDNWEIRWTAQGSLSIYVKQLDKDGADVAASQKGAGTGTTWRPTGGRFYLEVHGSGDWTVRVVPLLSGATRDVEELGAEDSSLKVGVIDPQRVPEQSKVGKRALYELKGYRDRLEKPLLVDEEELRGLEKALKTDRRLSDTQKRDKQSSFGPSCSTINGACRSSTKS